MPSVITPDTASQGAKIRHQTRENISSGQYIPQYEPAEERQRGDAAHQRAYGQLKK